MHRLVNTLNWVNLKGHLGHHRFAEEVTEPQRSEEMCQGHMTSLKQGRISSPSLALFPALCIWPFPIAILHMLRKEVGGHSGNANSCSRIYNIRLNIKI